jgi:aminopeptidase N
MTYSKAPEFVRMVELTIGADAFTKGLDAYHTKFKYGNATTMDWIEAMEKVCVRVIFKKKWTPKKQDKYSQTPFSQKKMVHFNYNVIVNII